MRSTENFKNYLLSSNAYAFLSINSLAKELKNHSFKTVDIKGLSIERTFQFVIIHGNYEKTAEKLKNFSLSQYNLKESRIKICDKNYPLKGRKFVL